MRWQSVTRTSIPDTRLMLDSVKEAIEDGKSPATWGTAREDAKRVSFLVSILVYVHLNAEASLGRMG